MGIIGILLLVIFVIAALLLILMVMIQDEQGEGLGGIFGGGSSTPFGSRSGNVLTRFTSILGAVFLITAFGLAWINRTPEGGDVVGAARRAQTESTNDWWRTDAAPEGTVPADGQAEAPAAVSGDEPAVQPSTEPSAGGN